jgi:hypothetical protein
MIDNTAQMLSMAHKFDFEPYSFLNNQSLKLQPETKYKRV